MKENLIQKVIILTTCSALGASALFGCSNNPANNEQATGDATEDTTTQNYGLYEHTDYTGESYGLDIEIDCPAYNNNMLPFDVYITGGPWLEFNDVLEFESPSGLPPKFSPTPVLVG